MDKLIENDKNIKDFEIQSFISSEKDNEDDLEDLG